MRNAALLSHARERYEANGLAEVMDRVVAAQGSFEHVLSKPSSPQALLHKVRAILDAKRPADAGDAR